MASANSSGEGTIFLTLHVSEIAYAINLQRSICVYASLPRDCRSLSMSPRHQRTEARGSESAHRGLAAIYCSLCVDRSRMSAQGSKLCLPSVQRIDAPIRSRDIRSTSQPTMLTLAIMSDDASEPLGTQVRRHGSQRAKVPNGPASPTPNPNRRNWQTNDRRRERRRRPRPESKVMRHTLRCRSSRRSRSRHPPRCRGSERCFRSSSDRAGAGLLSSCRCGDR